MDALESLLPRVTDPELRAGALEQRPQRAAQRRRRPGRRARARGRGACRSRTPRTPRAARWRGSTGWVVPLQPDPAAALAQLHAAARGQARRRRARPPRSSWRRSGPPSAPRPTRPCSAPGWPATDLPEGVPLDLDLRWRVLVQLATLGRGRPGRARPAARGRAHGGRPGAPRRRARLAARRRGEGLGLGLLHRRDQPAQLRARGGGLRLLARRPGGAHRAVRRALLRRPARHRQGAQRLGAGRGGRGLLPAHLA